VKRKRNTEYEVRLLVTVGLSLFLNNDKGMVWYGNRGQSGLPNSPSIRSLEREKKFQKNVLALSAAPDPGPIILGDIFWGYTCSSLITNPIRVNYFGDTNRIRSLKRVYIINSILVLLHKIVEYCLLVVLTLMVPRSRQ
jgi:hypothetical protein